MPMIKPPEEWPTKAASHKAKLAIDPPQSTPSTNQQIIYRNGRQFIGQSGRGSKIASDLVRLLSVQRPSEQFQGPLAVEVLLVYGFPTRTPKVRRKRMVPKSTRPDEDNFKKLLYDCMQRAGWIANDAQIAYSAFYKCHGAEVGIYVGMMEIDSDWKPEWRII